MATEMVAEENSAGIEVPKQIEVPAAIIELTGDVKADAAKLAETLFVILAQDDGIDLLANAFELLLTIANEETLDRFRQLREKLGQPLYNSLSNRQYARRMMSSSC